MRGDKVWSRAAFSLEPAWGDSGLGKGKTVQMEGSHNERFKEQWSSGHGVCSRPGLKPTRQSLD